MSIILITKTFTNRVNLLCKFPVREDYTNVSLNMTTRFYKLEERQDMIKKDRKLICRSNGQRGGRPKQDSEIRIELPYAELVILTPNQYNSLVEKYGYELLRRAIKILDGWLHSGSRISEKYVGRNNYAHFRSDGWVVNEARQSIKPQI